ncbi:unnamed protein product [Caenorhabditis auriculariae]|uniref:Uncharacterized protein n=1 Tax=Caenorhabditis auriculariae TaxID=2777116 RepID=A0A8S1HFU7_9PELO|nr:unnamed protein product [Caenorhabditis auriculariae]
MFKFFVLFFLVACFSQCSAETVRRLKELRTEVQPVRTFDAPKVAPRAKSLRFLRAPQAEERKTFQTPFKVRGAKTGSADFVRWRLDELTSAEMLSSAEVKAVRRPSFLDNDQVSGEASVGEFFP